MEADVLVVGSGPAGSSVAYWLARRGANLLLVDRSHFPREKPCGDGLTPEAVGRLERMGVLPKLRGSKSRRIRGARLCLPNGQVFDATFPAKPGGAPGYGMVLPRSELDNILREHAVAAGAQFLGGFRAVVPVWQGTQIVGVKGRLQGEDVQIHSTLIIVATGASTAFIKRLGFAEVGPPSAVGMRAYYDGVEGLDDRFEFYLGAIPYPGYAWIFPMSASAANVGIAVFAGREAVSAADLRSALEQFTQGDKWVGDRFRRARMTARPRGSAMRTAFPTTTVRSGRVLLVGEAAGLVDPVTGEGMTYAVASAEIAAEIATEALVSRDGSLAALARYEKALRDRFLGAFTGLDRLEQSYVARFCMRMAPRGSQRLLGVQIDTYGRVPHED